MCAKKTLLAAALFWAVAALRAQAPPPYTPLVWDEDWSYLSDSSQALDWSDAWKHWDLSPTAYVSFGGQLRERGEYLDYPAWGANPAHTGYLLQRYLLSSDWHLSNRLRFFLQAGSSFENGRDTGPRPGIDQSTLYLNQVFLDYAPSEWVTLRAGRQLVSLGSTRLFAIGAGLNVEQPFDGLRVTIQARGWNVDLLALRPTRVLDGYFQSRPNPQSETWGVYSTHPLSSKLNLDLYYIGLDRKSWRYSQGTGREQRETFGGRLWAQTPSWSYDLESTLQTGRFASGDIRAWAAGYHLRHRFMELDGGVTSGDQHRHDKTLGTFNPLFPNGSYLSQSLLIGPYNLYIVRPKLEFILTRKLTFNPNLEFLWRQSLTDGVYNIAGILTHPGIPSRQRYVGAQIQAELDYAFTRHLIGALTYEHFFSGAFLKQTPPNHNVNFLAPQFTYTF